MPVNTLEEAKAELNRLLKWGTWSDFTRQYVKFLQAYIERCENAERSGLHGNGLRARSAELCASAPPH